MIFGRFGGQQWLLPLLLVVLVCAPVVLAQSSDDEFLAMVGELREAGFADKEVIAERLMAPGHSSAGALLTAMLEDRLYVKEDQTVVIAKSIDESLTTFELLDPVSLRGVGSASPDTLTKVGTNNRLRRVLRTTVARFALASPDPSVRLAAVVRGRPRRGYVERCVHRRRSHCRCQPTTVSGCTTIKAERQFRQP